MSGYMPEVIKKADTTKNPKTIYLCKLIPKHAFIILNNIFLN